MDKSSIKERLWELRLNAISAYENLVFEQSVKSTKDKISGYSENDILMKPDAMQHMIRVLENERKTDNAISDFGRSRLSKKKDKTEEEERDAEADSILGKFGRSQCTTQPEEENTAMVGAGRKIEREKMGQISSAEKYFFKQVNILGKFLHEHSIEESFKCKSTKIDVENLNEMFEEVDTIEFEDESDRKKVLSQIKTIGNDNLFNFCDRKPHQCLVCPYYYEDFKEFWEMKNLREKTNRSGEDE